MAADDDTTNGERGTSMPLTDAQHIADKIQWELRTTDDPILWESELVGTIDEDDEKIRTVLSELESREVIRGKERQGDSGADRMVWLD